MKVTGLRIQVDGDIEFVLQTSTGDFIKLDWTGDVELRLVAGSEGHRTIYQQVNGLLNKEHYEVVPGKLTDDDHQL